MTNKNNSKFDGFCTLAPPKGTYKGTSSTTKLGLFDISKTKYVRVDIPLCTPVDIQLCTPATRTKNEAAFSQMVADIPAWVWDNSHEDRPKCAVCECTPATTLPEFVGESEDAGKHPNTHCQACAAKDERRFIDNPLACECGTSRFDNYRNCRKCVSKQACIGWNEACGERENYKHPGRCRACVLKRASELICADCKSIGVYICIGQFATHVAWQP